MAVGDAAVSAVSIHVGAMASSIGDDSTIFFEITFSVLPDGLFG
jgi:hypothetical protein